MFLPFVNVETSEVNVIYQKRKEDDSSLNNTESLLYTNMHLAIRNFNEMGLTEIYLINESNLKLQNRNDYYSNIIVTLEEFQADVENVVSDISCQFKVYCILGKYRQNVITNTQNRIWKGNII